MRTATVDELTLLGGPALQQHCRVWVEDPDGTMRDVTTDSVRLGGINWLVGATIDLDIDQPVSQATVTLIRESGTRSMSPLRTDSLNNRNNAAAYAPFLELGRDIQIDVAVTPVGVAPITVDWKPLFFGEIDVIRAHSNPLVISARDKGAQLVDTWLPRDTAIVVRDVTTPIPLEDVAARVVIGGVGEGMPAAPIYTPVSPAYDVTNFGYQREPVMEALQRLVDLRGWDIRYKWDSGTSAFRLTLHEPPRSKTVPDHTITPSQYLTVDQMALDRTNLRNKITVWYTSAEAGFVGLRRSVVVQDGVSVLTYGTRTIVIEEDSESSIDSNAEALTFANAILNDLKDPKAEQEVDLHLFWPAELWDLYQFSANGVHYDTAQNLAVVTIRHILTPTTGRTRLTVRGRVAGKYLGWWSRSGDPVVPNETFALSLNNFRVTSQTDTTLAYGWERGGAVIGVWVYDNLYATPVVGDPWPAGNDFPDTILNSGTDSYTAEKPALGYERYIQFVPRLADGTAGPVQRVVLGPVTVATGQVNITWRETTAGTNADAILTFSGPDRANSWRYAYSISAMPNEATTLLGTIVAGRIATVTLSAVLPAGAHIYVRAIPFEGTNGDGTALPSVMAEAERPTVATGEVHLTIKGNAALADVVISFSGPDRCNSWRYAYSESSMPSEASAAVGTIVVGRSAAVTVLATLSIGEHAYVRAIPYTGSAGDGLALPSVQAQTERQNKATTKPVFFSAIGTTAFDDLQQYQKGLPGGYVANRTTILATLLDKLPLPDGVTITGFTSLTYRTNGGDQAVVQFSKINRSTRVRTILATHTNITTGSIATIPTVGLAEVVDNATNVFVVEVILDGTAADDARCYDYGVTYDQANLSQSY